MRQTKPTGILPIDRLLSVHGFSKLMHAPSHVRGVSNVSTLGTLRTRVYYPKDGLTEQRVSFKTCVPE